MQQDFVSPPELLAEDNRLRGDPVSALPEDSDSWAQCRQKAPVVAAELQKQKILCLLLCLPDFWLILENFLEIQCNRNMKKLCYQLWARQSCERTGERKWNLNASHRKQCLQVAGGSVLLTTPSVLISTAVLQVISWGNTLHMPALQSHTPLRRK